MRKIYSNDQKTNYDKNEFLSSWACEWESSDEMGSRTLRQPNQRKVNLPWKDKSWRPLIDIHSSTKAIYKSVIDIMDFHNCNMDVYNSVMDIHNSAMYIHNSITDIQTCVFGK